MFTVFTLLVTSCLFGVVVVVVVVEEDELVVEFLIGTGVEVRGSG